MIEVFRMFTMENIGSYFHCWTWDGGLLWPIVTSLTEKNSIEFPLFFWALIHHWFPSSQFRSPLVLFNVYQEIPVTSKKSLKLNWKFILMQMNLTSKMTSYFNGKSMEKRCLGKTIVFLNGLPVKWCHCSMHNKW